MSPAPKRRAKDKKDLWSRLRDPTQLRMFLTSLVLSIGYLAVFSPLSGSIDESRRQLKAENKRLEVASEIESLREQYLSFKDRLPDKSDTNEWVKYILAGIRQFPVKLVVLDPEEVRKLGPYQVVVLKIDLEGSLKDMNDFLKWLETNERIIRIDNMNIVPNQRKGTGLGMRLTLLGVMT